MSRLSIIFGIYLLAMPLSHADDTFQQMLQKGGELVRKTYINVKQNIDTKKAQWEGLEFMTPAITSHHSTGLQISMTANPVMEGEKAWDGVRGYAIVVEANMTSPPDLLPCILERGSSKPKCYFHATAKTEDNKPASQCHDSLECDWLIPTPKLPAMVLFFDYDYGLGGNDFVEALLIADENQQSDVNNIIRLQGIASNFVRTFAPGPIYRRNSHLRLERYMNQVVAPFDCVEGCQLTQSQVTIQPVEW